MNLRDMIVVASIRQYSKDSSLRDYAQEAFTGWHRLFSSECRQGTYKAGRIMKTKLEPRWVVVGALAPAMVASVPARAEMSATGLAKLAQNPVGNLISVPFQNNTNFNVGPEKGTQNILNIQPVIPISRERRLERHHAHYHAGHLAAVDWCWTGHRHRSGRHQFTAFLSPAKPGSWIWGAGAIASCPPTPMRLGNDRWGLGPIAVVLHLGKGDPWVYGVLVNNVWSVGGGGSPTAMSCCNPSSTTTSRKVSISLRPDHHGRLGGRSGDRWTVPLGGGVGKIFHLGRLPVNTQLSAYYNVVQPDNGANWQIRAQVQLMFPK